MPSNESTKMKEWNKMNLYICDYDWSSGSFMLKQKQSHFHANRSINIWTKNRNIWL